MCEGSLQSAKLADTERQGLSASFATTPTVDSSVTLRTSHVRDGVALIRYRVCNAGERRRHISIGSSHLGARKSPFPIDRRQHTHPVWRFVEEIGGPGLEMRPLLDVHHRVQAYLGAQRTRKARMAEAAAFSRRDVQYGARTASIAAMCGLPYRPLPPLMSA